MNNHSISDLSSNDCLSPELLRSPEPIIEELEEID